MEAEHERAASPALQQVNGYSPLKAGLAFLPAGLATMGGAIVGTRLVTRLGVRRQLVVGPLMAAVGRPETAEEALGRLARNAVHDLSDPYSPQLRACGDDTCSGIFLDPTGRRRWCSDERCGNRLRVRAHRARAQKA